jgi:hypothetical protein
MKRGLIAVLASMLLALAGASAARAATFTVTDGADRAVADATHCPANDVDDGCGLRDAPSVAQAGDTVAVAPGVGVLTLDHTLVLPDMGAAPIVIALDGAQLDFVPSSAAGPVPAIQVDGQHQTSPSPAQRPGRAAAGTTRG